MKFGKYEVKKLGDDVHTYDHNIALRQWMIGFKNGYEASVITGEYTAYTSKEHPYQLAVLKNGKLCEDTLIKDGIIGYLTADEVGEILEKIEALPKA